jgi:uncharacterized protein
MTPEEGQFAVRTARQVIEKWVRDEEKIEITEFPQSFGDDHGVFVTLHTYSDKELRGCIGIPEPKMALIDALLESALSVTRDPRFPRLKRTELPEIIVEVSILTKPEPIKTGKIADYPKNIVVGKDGLIVRKGHFSGLLLPQVAVEWDWNAEEFLMQTCLKAGLAPDEWKTGGCKIYKFRAQVFSEKKPPY